MAGFLPYIQVILSVLLIAAILTQRSEAGLGSAFGGGDSSIQYKRRGADRALFIGTIVLAILFAVSALIALII